MPARHAPKGLAAALGAAALPAPASADAATRNVYAKVIDGKALDASGVFQGQGAPPDYVVRFAEAGQGAVQGQGREGRRQAGRRDRQGGEEAGRRGPGEERGPRRNDRKEVAFVFGPEAFLAETAAKFISPGAQGIAYDPLSVYPSDPGALSYEGASA